MRILVINGGSTSMKLKLYNMMDETVLAECNCQRVGLSDSEIKYVDGSGTKRVFTRDLPDHHEALRYFIELITSGETKVIDGIADIAALGHRIAIGGPKYPGAALWDEEVFAELNRFQELGPLHVVKQIRILRDCEDLFGKDIPMVAGFDTSFHHTMSEVAKVYPLPREWREKYDMYRFGYHGLSYQYVADRYRELTGCDYRDHCMVVVHMGGGGSVSPIRNGKSLDNSFGMGSGEGPSGGTRLGTFDHSLINYIAKRTNLTLDEIDDVFMTKSGMVALAGTSDMKEIEDRAAEGDRDAQLALDVNVYQIKKYIGAYAFEMGRLDTLVFTGGVGENSPVMRERYCENLEHFGLRVDPDKNREFNRRDGKISAADSRVDIWVIPTNEELVIARDTARIIAG